MENNFGITTEKDIWTVNFSYFSHVKKLLRYNRDVV